jgi:hypothetical protein
MPAFEVMQTLVRLGVPCAVKMSATGDLLITALESGERYTTAEACVKGELGEEENEDGE